MDHFNATVHNGALVSTRRGMHISKTKHQGTRFVNTFAAPATSTPSSRSSSAGPSSRGVLGAHGQDGTSQFRVAGGRQQQKRPQQERKFKFVDKPNEKVKGAPRGRPRKSPTSASTPSSGEESSEDFVTRSHLDLPNTDANPTLPISSEQIFATYDPISTYMPKEWKSYQVQHGQTEPSQKLIHMYLQQVPQQLYPCDELLTYNPVRDPRMFNAVNGDIFSMEGMTMMATLMETILKGDTSFGDLDPYLNRVCGMLSERLMMEISDIDLAVLDCISTMAICSLYMSRGDAWHVHMKALRYVVAQHGGLSASWGPLLTRIRKADVKGAAYTGDLPYLEFTRFFAPISDIVPPDLKSNISIAVHHLLQSCGIAQVIIESVRALVFATRSVDLARHSPPGSHGSVLFDPNSFVEEFAWVEYQLVQYPGPLRDPRTPLENSEYTGRYPLPRDTTHYGYQQTYSHAPADDRINAMTFHAHGNLPTKTTNILDPVVRIASILYVEEFIPELTTINPYGVQLALLNHQMLEIVLLLRNRTAAFLAGTASSPDDFSFDGLHRDTPALRPVLVWVCVVAYTVAQIVETNPNFYTHPIDRTPYQDCVALLLGATSPDDVAALPASDFELANLLPVHSLGSLGFENEAVLKQITADYEARQMVAIAPFL